MLQTTNDLLESLYHSVARRRGNIVWNDVNIEWKEVIDRNTYMFHTSISHDWRYKLPISHLNEFINDMNEKIENPIATRITYYFSDNNHVDSFPDPSSIKKHLLSGYEFMCEHYFFSRKDKVFTYKVISDDNNMVGCYYKLHKYYEYHINDVKIYEYQDFIRIPGLAKLIIKSKDAIKNAAEFPEGLIDIILCYMF